VVGDAVNLASRVEGLGRTMGSRILICQETFHAVEQDVWARGPLTAQVAGKEEPVIVFEILGWREHGIGLDSDEELAPTACAERTAWSPGQNGHAAR